MAQNANKTRGFDFAYTKPFSHANAATEACKMTVNSHDADCHHNMHYTSKAISWLQHAARQPDRPFFLFMSYHGIHAPNIIGDKERDEMREHPDAEADTERNSPLLGAMLKQLDRQVGRLVEFVHGQAYSDNTLFVVYGDNGAAIARNGRVTDGMIRGMKGALYQGGIHVPLVVSGKGVVDPGRRSSTLVMAEDLFATTSDVAGVAPGELAERFTKRWGHMEGRSFKHALDLRGTAEQQPAHPNAATRARGPRTFVAMHQPHYVFHGTRDVRRPGGVYVEAADQAQRSSAPSPCEATALGGITAATRSTHVDAQVDANAAAAAGRLPTTAAGTAAAPETAAPATAGCSHTSGHTVEGEHLWKLIVNYEQEITDCPGQYELYDLAADPGEATDLAAASAHHSAVVSDLAHKFRIWREATDAAMPTPSPCGAPTASLVSPATAAMEGYTALENAEVPGGVRLRSTWPGTDPAALTWGAVGETLRYATRGCTSSDGTQQPQCDAGYEPCGLVDESRLRSHAFVGSNAKLDFQGSAAGKHAGGPFVTDACPTREGRHVKCCEATGGGGLAFEGYHLKGCADSCTAADWCVAFTFTNATARCDRYGSLVFQHEHGLEEVAGQGTGVSTHMACWGQAGSCRHDEPM